MRTSRPAWQSTAWTAAAASIGVALDGTGYGLDGAIWGGEFLLADYIDFARPLHLEYFPLPGGDAAIKHPARVALALLWALDQEWATYLAPAREFTEQELGLLRTQLEGAINAPRTSSMGRLFDAAASLAGVRQSVNYEAQAAIEFEALVDASESGAYPFDIGADTIGLLPAVLSLLEDVRVGKPIPVIAARFHNGIAALVAAASTRPARSHWHSEGGALGGSLAEYHLITTYFVTFARAGLSGIHTSRGAGE